jgi:hypothetical protein
MRSVRRIVANISKGKRIAIISVVVTLGLAPIVLAALIQVARGHGADTYQNVYGMLIHWVTVLTLVAYLAIALLVGLVVRWWQLRDDRTMNRLIAKSRPTPRDGGGT